MGDRGRAFDRASGQPGLHGRTGVAGNAAGALGDPPGPVGHDRQRRPGRPRRLGGCPAVQRLRRRGLRNLGRPVRADRHRRPGDLVAGRHRHVHLPADRPARLRFHRRPGTQLDADRRVSRRPAAGPQRGQVHRRQGFADGDPGADRFGDPRADQRSAVADPAGQRQTADRRRGQLLRQRRRRQRRGPRGPGAALRRAGLEPVLQPRPPLGGRCFRGVLIRAPATSRSRSRGCRRIRRRS
ncbi:PE-PGRS family protein [Stackebrandtia nassauensis DSM 44728]|uniref:PE-PGRS family protein n=1 Tax=Stackebrandtia nassauensis (strain DSM 44728 / CIP 108903 / NRRL B-16338 / NBRC 102104 / LLR-40K-21) TaxID=446470 RepID=D3Q0N6_STANL|nr:PE-PGRS family protein [Stackebrandtia nassauensis DSM 44728]